MTNRFIKLKLKTNLYSAIKSGDSEAPLISALYKLFVCFLHFFFLLSSFFYAFFLTYLLPYLFTS